MKITFPIALALCASLTLAGQTRRPASAQPANPIPPVPQISVISSRADEKAEPLLTLRASDSSVAAVLSALSAKTGAKIIINADAPLNEVDIKRTSLSEAIARVVELANLKLSVEPPANLAPLADRIYIVNKADAPGMPKGRLDMEFKSIDVAQIVKILSEQFAIKARVEADTSGRLLDIYMSNTSALEALQIIADAADLEVTKSADGYLLKSRAPDETKVAP